MSNKIIKNQTGASANSKTLKITSKLPDVKAAYPVIIIINFALIIGSLMTGIINAIVKNQTGIAVSATIIVINIICLIVLKYATNWYPQAELKATDKYLTYKYYVAGIGKYAEYRIEKVDNIKILKDSILITGILKHRPAARLTFEPIKKYKLFTGNSDKNEIAELIKLYQNSDVAKNLDKIIKESENKDDKCTEPDLYTEALNNIAKKAKEKNENAYEEAVKGNTEDSVYKEPSAQDIEEQVKAFKEESKEDDNAYGKAFGRTDSFTTTGGTTVSVKKE